MKIEIIGKLKDRSEGELLLVPFWQGKKQAEIAVADPYLKGVIDAPIHAGDFLGKESDLEILYPQEKIEKRIILIGLGEEEKITVEKLRHAYGAAGQLARKKRLTRIHLLLPKSKKISSENSIRGILEGLLAVNYSYDFLKGEESKKETPPLFKTIGLIDGSKKEVDQAKDLVTIYEGVYFCRNLINGNADDITPKRLAEEAKKIAKNHSHVEAIIFDKKRIIKEKMGLLLAVNRGSAIDPAFIILKYRGDHRSKDHTVIVGKGVTFDTGGLNLKPTGFMEDMKCDMSGAAVALATIATAAKLGLKINLTAVVPSTDNSISSTSYKPGDVYVGYSGKTVEIGNTDAEGRLILADALAYTVKNLKPNRIIDFATLTGACIVALGQETAGLMSNNDNLVKHLKKAGDATYERVWQLPLFKEYRDQLKSDFADINNNGGREAGAITAAIFLQEFVGDVPWAHLDIAGVAYAGKNKKHQPKNATGFGVRLMIEFLRGMNES